MIKNNIMLKKIILPVVMLVFAQQDFYGMNDQDHQKEKKKQKDDKWKNINNWVNMDALADNDKFYPKLWWLWVILDNVPFQYGGSKIWKHGEAYYGLSNGIGFFPSFLNFGWMKIGIGDAHINVINLILDYFKCFIQNKRVGKDDLLCFLVHPIAFNLFLNIHIISVKILNCIKIKLIAPLALLMAKNEWVVGKTDYKYHSAWYIIYDNWIKTSYWYGFWSPRIEINIPELINYFFNKKVF